MTNDPRALANLSTADYDAIELAVMETARGRWFLKEFAARNRQADTTVLLEAIARLEGAVSGEHAAEQIERVRFDLVEMAKSIAGLKAELETQEHGGEHGRFGAATSTLDDIVKTTELATSSILGAAEHVQEIAWSLREQQLDRAACDTLDKLATEIYTACGFQDLTAQRTQKVVRTLRFLEGRIHALIDAWSSRGPVGDATSAGPQYHGAASSVHHRPPVPHGGQPLIDLSQSDVDFVIVDDPFGLTESLRENDIPDNVMSALSMAEAAGDMDHRADKMRPMAATVVNPIEDKAPEPGDELMASDELPVIIDDLETLEVDFVRFDQDVVVDMTAKPLPTRPENGPSPSLAVLDAMPTTAKALIFG